VLCRLQIINATSRCRGVAPVPGLGILNNENVTALDRVAAFEQYCHISSGAARQAAVALYHCRLALTRLYGQEAVEALHPLSHAATATKGGCVSRMAWVAWVVGPVVGAILCVVPAVDDAAR
jgi:hypothetical protein